MFFSRTRRAGAASGEGEVGRAEGGVEGGEAGALPQSRGARVARGSSRSSSRGSARGWQGGPKEEELRGWGGEEEGRRRAASSSEPVIAVGGDKRPQCCCHYCCCGCRLAAVPLRHQSPQPPTTDRYVDARRHARLSGGAPGYAPRRLLLCATSRRADSNPPSDRDGGGHLRLLAADRLGLGSLLGAHRADEDHDGVADLRASARGQLAEEEALRRAGSVRSGRKKRTSRMMRPAK